MSCSIYDDDDDKNDPLDPPLFIASKLGIENGFSQRHSIPHIIYGRYIFEY